MEVTIIKGNGYTKYLFGKLGLPKDEQFSLFFWHDGESLPHDHSVDEITYVVKGKLREIRKVKKRFVTTFYTEGMQFDVPAGTKHIVKAEGSTITINFCKGPLFMNILKDFLRDS